MKRRFSSNPLTPGLCEFVKPLIQVLPVGRGTVLRCLGGVNSDASLWKDKKQHRTFYDRAIDAYICADVADFSGRLHYFTGQHQDRQNQYVIKKYLRQGDTFIDIGSNVGVHTILAAQIVGTNGHVYAFEPQKKLVEIIQAQLVINQLKNVHLYWMGLGDERSELLLSNPLDFNTGTATFRAIAESEQQIDRVQVERGEDILPDLSESRVLIKIDVEGFEFRVLKGLGELLSSQKIALLVEVTDTWLRELGSSASEIHCLLKSYGFCPYLIKKSLFGSYRLEEFTSAPSHQHDVLFVKPEFLSSIAL